MSASASWMPPSALVGEQVFKTCACGVAYTRAGWRALPLANPECPRWDVAGDGVDILELRNCCCGSTLAIEVA